MILAKVMMRSESITLLGDVLTFAGCADVDLAPLSRKEKIRVYFP
jgi:hypothetical protein